MKTQVTLLAVCLLSMGLATAQTTTNSSSTTTTSSTYGTTPTTGTAPTTSTDSSNTSGSMNNSATMSNGSTTNSTGTMNNGSTTNSTASPAYGTTTTTTTTTNNADMQSDANMREKSDRSWGKTGKFGIYAGANFSRFVNEPIPDGAYRAGYQVGIYGRSGGTIFGQLGLEYRTSTSNLVRNGTGTTTQPVSQIRGQIDQQFIAIPAYVGVRVGSALGLRIQAGAELATLIRHPNNEFGINNDDIRRTILNGLVGAGINLGPLTLDAVYNHGFSNVFEGADTKRNLLALNLGFRF
jgi:hypothetical protein